MSTLASMYTHTADWLTTHRRWTPQPAPLDQSAAREQAQRVQLAFHCAYRRFAQRYPAWVARRFDEEFLRQAMHRWLSCQGSSTQASGVLPSGYELAWAWDRQFGLLVSEPLRTRQVAELTGVATHFLYLVAHGTPVP